MFLAGLESGADADVLGPSHFFRPSPSAKNAMNDMIRAARPRVWTAQESSDVSAWVASWQGWICFRLIVGTHPHVIMPEYPIKEL